MKESFISFFYMDIKPEMKFIGYQEIRDILYSDEIIEDYEEAM